MAKENEGKPTRPCLVCGEPHNYLTTSHMRSKHDRYPQSVPEYREWLVDTFDLDADDPAVVKNGPLAAELWPTYKHKFDGWRDR